MNKCAIARQNGTASKSAPLTGKTTEFRDLAVLVVAMTRLVIGLGSNFHHSFGCENHDF